MVAKEKLIGSVTIEKTDRESGAAARKKGRRTKDQGYVRIGWTVRSRWGPERRGPGGATSLG